MIPMEVTHGMLMDILEMILIVFTVILDGVEVVMAGTHSHRWVDFQTAKEHFLMFIQEL